MHYNSEVIVGTCGDYRIARFLLKYLKRIHQLWEMDLLTTAGGSRTISFFDMKEGDPGYERLKIKELAFWIDFATYLGHCAKTCVIADHSTCGFWPKFSSDEEEDEAHIQSLLKARKIMLEKYPQIKEVLLVYIIVHKETHEAIKIKTISPDGKVKTIIVKKEERLAYAEREVERIKQKK